MLLSYLPHTSYVTSSWELNKIGTFHDIPLLFNLEIDAQEAWPIDPLSQEYIEAFAYIDEAVKAHKATLTPVVNQQVSAVVS